MSLEDVLHIDLLGMAARDPLLLFLPAGTKSGLRYCHSAGGPLY